MSEVEWAGWGVLLHVNTLLLKKKIGFKELKLLPELAKAIEEYREYHIENVLRTILVDERLQLYLCVDGSWIYNCTFTKTQ